MSRRGSLILLLLLCAALTACDSIQSFYIRNVTDEPYFVRVTVNRTGTIYVHQVDPRSAGYASQGVVPGPGDEGDVFSVELLDATCDPIGEWGMPSSGGYLEISAAPRFIRGFEAALAAAEASDGPKPTGSPANSLPHATIMECGATDTL
jgi:hypothetical protein